MPSSKHYGTPGKSITGKRRAQVIAWIKEGLPRNEVARRAGLGRGTISGIAKAEGLTFERSVAVKAALEARTVDLATRRQRIIDRAYTRVEHLQDRLEADQFDTVMREPMGAESARRLNFVPTVDERNVADTINRYVVATTRLAEVDADRGDEGARSMIGALAAGLQAAYHALPAEADGDGDPAS